MKHTHVHAAPDEVVHVSRNRPAVKPTNQYSWKWIAMGALGATMIFEVLVEVLVPLLWLACIISGVVAFGMFFSDHKAGAGPGRLLNPKSSMSQTLKFFWVTLALAIGLPFVLQVVVMLRTVAIVVLVA